MVVTVASLFSKFAIFLERYQPREPAVKVFLKSFIDTIFPGSDWSLKTVFNCFRWQNKIINHGGWQCNQYLAMVSLVLDTVLGQSPIVDTVA